MGVTPRNESEAFVDGKKAITAAAQFRLSGGSFHFTPVGLLVACHSAQ